VCAAEIEMKSLEDGAKVSPDAEAGGETASSTVVELDGAKKSSSGVE